MVAVAQGRHVGVDVERLRTDVRFDEIVRRYFSAREATEFQGLPAAEREQAFFAAWTRKEAYVKARGRGLKIPFDAFSVSMSHLTPAALVEADAEDRTGRWVLLDLSVATRFAAAVAVAAPCERVECRAWPEY